MNITKTLADALSSLLSLNRTQGASDAEYEAAETAADAALNTYDREYPNRKRIDAMTDDEIAAELSKPDKRWTVEHNNWSPDHAARVWFVRDSVTGGLVRFPFATSGPHTGEGFAGKQRAIAVARALNELEK